MFFHLGHIFLSQCTCYVVRGQRRRYLPGSGNPLCCCCGTICGGGTRKGTMPLAQLSADFQSLPPLPTSKLVPSGAVFQMSGFVYVLEHTQIHPPVNQHLKRHNLFTGSEGSDGKWGESRASGTVPSLTPSLYTVPQHSDVSCPTLLNS